MSTAANKPALEEALAGVEQSIQALSAAFAQNDAAVLLAASVQLRDVALSFAQQAQRPALRQALAAADLQPRLAAVASFLNLHRDHLARLVAFNDRQLQVVLPASTDTNTYGQTAASGPARIYNALG